MKYDLQFLWESTINSSAHEAGWQIKIDLLNIHHPFYWLVCYQVILIYRYNFNFSLSFSPTLPLYLSLSPSTYLSFHVYFSVLVRSPPPPPHFELPMVKSLVGLFIPITLTVSSLLSSWNSYPTNLQYNLFWFSLWSSRWLNRMYM